MRHALEADHISAVATLATKSNSSKSMVKIAATWGLGHTITLFIMGFIVLSMNFTLTDTVASTLELLVGIMLVAMGLEVLWRMKKDGLHFHSHSHGGKKHAHLHAHAGQLSTQQHNRASHDHPHVSAFPLRSLFVGMMHGMAGSAALLVLALGAAKSTASALSYIAIFGVGSIAGMALFTMVISLPINLASKRLSDQRFSSWLGSGLKGSIGLATITLGVLLAYESGASILLQG